MLQVTDAMPFNSNCLLYKTDQNLFNLLMVRPAAYSNGSCSLFRFKLANMLVNLPLISSYYCHSFRREVARGGMEKDRRC